MGMRAENSGNYPPICEKNEAGEDLRILHYNTLGDNDVKGILSGKGEASKSWLFSKIHGLSLLSLSLPSTGS